MAGSAYRFFPLSGRSVAPEMDAGAMMVLPGEDFNRWRRIPAFDSAGE